MYNISIRIVKDPMEAEDIMQEAFLSAFEKINSFSGTVSFGAWLKKIVENRSLDFVRKNNPVFVELKDDRITSPSEDDSFQEVIKSYIDRIKEAVNTLPKGYRTILSMNLFEGLDHEEISQVLGIDPNSSRSQFSRARAKLVKKLNFNRIQY
jgi:RNA polymerase sigma factor (sigma-70 family)